MSGTDAEPAAVERALAALAEGRCCKVICGIGSRKARRIRNLAALYSLAGAHVIDMAPHIDVLQAVHAGLRWAHYHAPALRPDATFAEPMLMVSLGVEADPHVGIPLLDRSVCATCPHCYCEEQRDCVARPLEERAAECPDCLECVRACPFDAISVVAPGVGNPALLRELLLRGAQAVELHISGAPAPAVGRLCTTILRELTDRAVLSFSVGSQVTSEELLEEHVALIAALDRDRVVFQAEGHPMSGDLGNGVPRAQASLDLVRSLLDRGVRSPIHASGGCDLNTSALAKERGVPLSGVAFGSFARSLVGDVLDRELLDPDDPAVLEALGKAIQLVESVHP